jgi:Dihydroprymidine dehydrogenase domain II, 4Fe-4S cluster/NAD(P)-binding Rossmann-like domain
MTARNSDFTPVIDMFRQRSTGPTRAQRPVYVDLLPPCNNACPAGENVQAWLDLAQTRKYREAWEAILRDNPFPAVHGRVCYHPCETHCNRGQLDSAVSIHAVERFLGDLAAEQAWGPPVSAAPSGKRILVVGGGPSGLSAAYHLARRGHSVEVRDAGPLPGGMLHFGIPAYRLPRADLMKEVRRIEAMGLGSPSITRSKTYSPSRPRAISMPSSSRSARRSAGGSTSRRAMPHASSTPSHCCTTSKPAIRRVLVAASSFTGAAIRRLTLRERRAGSVLKRR